MKKRILYAVANYAEIVRDNGYFVDKTEYIKKLEAVNNPDWPRSLMIPSILERVHGNRVDAPIYGLLD